MLETLLPVGSVVLLKGGSKKTIIMGIMQIKQGEPDKVYDYIGVPYPEGYLGGKSSYLFNNSDILDVIFKGYHNSERDGMLKAIEMIYEQANREIGQKSI